MFKELLEYTKGINLDWIQVIGVIVALFSLVVSYLVYMHTTKQRKRNLLVKLSWGFLVYENNTLSKGVYLFIEVNNIASEPSIVSNFNILTSNTKKKYAITAPYSDVRYPHRLQGGESCRVWINKDELFETFGRSGIVKPTMSLRAEVADGVGEKYISNKLKVEN